MDVSEWQRFQAIVKPGMRVRYTGAQPKRSDLSVMNAGDEGLLIANDVDGREDILEELPVSAFNDPDSAPFYIHVFSMDYWIGGKWVAGQRVYDLMLITKVHELIDDFRLRGIEKRSPMRLNKDEYWLLRKVSEMQIEESICLPIVRESSGNIRFLGQKIMVGGRFQ